MTTSACRTCHAPIGQPCDESRPHKGLVSPGLTDLDALVADVANGDITAGHALALLRKRDCTADGYALLDATQALRVRDDLVAGLLDPAHYLEARVTAPLADLWQLAVDVAETVYDEALLSLARPSRVKAIAS